jgi:NADH:ubiquinone oxidoreductase subunit 2 (subunit N)
MQTLAILFFVLSLVNIPIFLMYSSQTSNNDYYNLNKVFKYFTLGNIAQTTKICGFSTVSYQDFGMPKPDPDILGA